MRTSPVHYIAPSAISIVPNCNGSANDLSVTISRGTKIKVYSPRTKIDKTLNGEYQEWTLTGRNRRLADSTKPYTIYARLSTLDNTAYLIFAPMTPQESGEYMSAWTQAYSWVTTDGLYVFGKGTDREEQRTKTNCIFVRLGNVSLPDANNQRTVTLDTGILGTDQFNDEWALRPDELPLRIELGCTIGDEDAGPTPYVYWGESLVLTAMLTEGWTGTDIQRFDRWEIIRNSGDGDADNAWNYQEVEGQETPTPRQMTNGQITLNHNRGADDDFNGAVSVTFAILAVGHNAETLQPEILKTATINIMAETVEKYELSLSENIVSYDPQTQDYTPADGVNVGIRATDQRGEVFDMTRGQIHNASLVAEYSSVDSTQWTALTFGGSLRDAATANIATTAFALQQSVNVRLMRRITTDGQTVEKELSRTTIAFVRNGEDSKIREWIYRLNSNAGYNATTGTAGGTAVSGQTDGVDNCLLVDDFVPTGWSDDPTGVSQPGDVEWESWRDYDDENHRWGAFQTPVIHNRYAEDGVTYRLECNVESILIPADETSVTQNLRVKLYQRKGINSEEEYSCYWAVYNRYGSTFRRTFSTNNKRASISIDNYTISSESGSAVYAEAVVFVCAQQTLDSESYESSFPETIITKTEISVIKNGDNGKNGTSPWISDLSNEIDSVACNLKGHPTAAKSLTTMISLFYGHAAKTFGTPKVKRNGTAMTVNASSYTNGVRVTYSNKILTVIYDTSAVILDTDEYEITITATDDRTVVHTLTFSVLGARPGATGEAAITYQLVPSVSEIIRRKDGTYSPTSLTCYCTSLKAGTATDNPTEATMQYSYDGSIWTAFTSDTSFAASIVYAQTGKKLHLQLLVNGKVMDKETIPVLEDGDDAQDVNPNILLRTIFDRGMPFVLEAWTRNSELIDVDGATDTIVNGRKSIRMNASALSQDLDFQQNVYGKVKPSTWYTLSFNYFATQLFCTFLYDASDTNPWIDLAEGCYIDGADTPTAVTRIDGLHEWPAEWSGNRHSITFKTASTFSANTLHVLFRCLQGGQVAICMPKLEEGRAATAYMAHESDLKGDNAPYNEHAYALSRSRTSHADGDLYQVNGVRWFPSAPDPKPTHPYVWERITHYTAAGVNDQTSYICLTGAVGAMGKLCYMAGEYRTDVEYTSNDSQTVAVEVKGTGETTDIYYLNAETNVVDGRHIGPTDSGQTIWVQGMSQYNLVRTRYLFADFAQFGAAVVSGDWLISVHGTINGTAYEGEYADPDTYTNGSETKPTYFWFDPIYPNEDHAGKDKVPGSPSEGQWASDHHNFIPHYAVNLLTGKTYQNDAVVRGVVHASLLFQQTYGITNTDKTNPYIIDPENNPYSCYQIGGGTSTGSVYAILPDPLLYDGLELRFIILSALTSALESTIHLKISTQEPICWIGSGAVLYIGSRRIELHTGLIDLKSVGGYWVVLQGNVSSDSDSSW